MPTDFLLGLLYAKFHPSERTKRIRIYFRCTESAIVDACLKRFKGTSFKHKNYILYEIISFKDLQHLRGIVIKTNYAPLQCWRPFLDQFAPLPKRCKGMTKSFLARRRKTLRHKLTLESENPRTSLAHIQEQASFPLLAPTLLPVEECFLTPPSLLTEAKSST